MKILFEESIISESGFDSFHFSASTFLVAFVLDFVAGVSVCLLREREREREKKRGN